jgi:homoserine O-acetyltransferase/O-succinyltransferase
MADARQYFDLPSPFLMSRGGNIKRARLAYETWGELNEDRSNAVLVLTGLSPGAHAASSPDDPDSGWWEGIIGPGLPIDTNTLFVICINSLGSCKGSTGPASINPETRQPYRLTFPELTLDDIAATSYVLVKSFEIERLHALVGPSMGGMSAQAYAAQFPASATNLLLISTAPYALPFAIGLRSLQREAIRLDPNWNNGDYTDDSLPANGLRIARKLGVVTYRSAFEWKERFGRHRIGSSTTAPTPFGPEFQIESYLEGHAQRFVGSFDPNCYLYLSRAMDWFDVAAYGGSVSAGLKSMQAKRALVIGVTTDILFPLEQQQEIAEGLRNAGTQVDYVELPSIQGHDSFLVDIERFGAAIARFMSSL